MSNFCRNSQSVCNTYLISSLIVHKFKINLSLDDDCNGGNMNQNSLIKQVVRKRAPIFPFEPEDHYVPDNNSNNIIPKGDINPPPTSAERRQGYCLRPFRDTGQQRYICTVCGKHYTTMYNMRQHRNIHTGSGLHSCRYCGRSFTHKHVWEVCLSLPIDMLLLSYY